MSSNNNSRQAGRLDDLALASNNISMGPAASASANVLINCRRALRVADNGEYHDQYREWSAIEGSATVLINNLPAHRVGDKVKSGGDVGHLISGSPNVIIGEHTARKTEHRRGILLVQVSHEPLRPGRRR